MYSLFSFKLKTTHPKNGSSSISPKIELNKDMSCIQWLLIVIGPAAIPSTMFDRGNQTPDSLKTTAYCCSPTVKNPIIPEQLLL